MKIKKENVQNLVKAILFLAIIFMLFLFFTYLFRNTGRTARENILEYYEEEENSLDVVFVGASNVVRYWDPLRAWNEYGFTSRNYATLGMTADTYLYALKDALRTQNPKLVVVEARLFSRNYEKGIITAGGRNFLDSLEYGFFRAEAVKYYCETMGISRKEALSLYIDLIQYHDNYETLIDKDHWALADNRVDDVEDYKRIYKGYGFIDKVAFFDDSTEIAMRDERSELEETAKKLYTDIIDYCQSNDINLMFVLTPIVVGENEVTRFNELAALAADYGVPFVDTNKLYDEMGIDFSQDFYSRNHTNILGADKFTDYFAAYLTENYDLPDHRGESVYASWDELYAKYSVDAETARENARKVIAKDQVALEVEVAMKASNNPAEWFAMANNSEITLLMAANEQMEGVPSAASQEVLNMVGITEDYFAGSGELKLVYNKKVKYKDFATGRQSGIIGEEDTPYSILLGEESEILIAEENYFDSSKEGIQIVAFDNNTEEIFDVICLKVASDGSLIMER